jgi:hypothetical protein
MTNPEDAVIADIDALIDAQLAAGPHDDYSADYYPKCACGCDWHGLVCRQCGCPEYRQPERKVLAVNPEFINDDGRPGYTLADVERLRWHRDRPGYTLDFVEVPQRVIRLAQHHPEGTMEMVEGFVQILSVDLNAHGITVHMRVDSIRRETIQGLRLAHVEEGMISVEGGTPEGFQPLGYLHAEDLDIEHTTEAAYVWGGDVVRLQERYEVTMRINAEVSEPFLRQLGGTPP